MLRTSGIFTIHQFYIEFVKYNQPIYLIPFGDIHRDAPGCDVKRWLEFCEWAKNKTGAYFLGMGDYFDFASASERVILRDTRWHQSSIETLEDYYRQKIEKFYNEISFMEGRIIGLIEGNHYAEFSNGTTTTQLLAEKLKCKYLGVSAFIRLHFRRVNTPKRSHSHTIDIWAHHGKGGGRLIGGSLNRVQQMGEIAEADIYLMGDDHKKSVGLMTRLKLSRAQYNIKLQQRKQLYGRTGSFLRGYVPEKRSYVVDKLLTPTDLGTLKIELTPKREHFTEENKRKDNRYIDIHCSI